MATRKQLPANVRKFLGNLVYEPKREYATAYARFVFNGAAKPKDPGTGWAVKARKRIDSLVPAAKVAA